MGIALAQKENEAQALERALETVGKALAEMQFGTLTIVFQDSRPIQLERQEKIRLDQTELQDAARPLQQWQAALRKAVKGLAYGQVLLRIQNGRINQLERTDKQRFAELEGMYGDGI